MQTPTHIQKGWAWNGLYTVAPAADKKLSGYLDFLNDQRRQIILLREQATDIQSGKAALKTARRTRVLFEKLGNPVFIPAGSLNKEARDLHTLILAY